MGTEQEAFWKGDFGDEYAKRNVGLVEANTAFFAKALNRTYGIQRVIELGAGTGQNMLALTRLLPNAEVMGVEINESAAMQIPVGYVFRQSIFDFQPPNVVCVDLAFTKGVLIHVAPEDLPKAYAKLYECSQRYILVAEYFNPTPVEVEYRGHTGKLWKRDFAGEMLDLFPDLQVVDYGFAWRRDGLAPQDDLNWTLMEKIA